MSATQLIGFSPDLDPATPGVVVDCQQMLPTNNGMEAAPQPVDAGLTALDSACKGAFVGTLLDGTRRAVAGTTAKLWDISGGAWVDRSQAGGYTGANRWRFTMFGSNVLACNRAQRIQQAAPSSNFADIPTAPAAGVMCSASGFVLVGDVADLTGSFGDQPDGWWCSGLYDQTIWTPSTATQCANGRLVDAPGRILAMREFGPQVVAYKSESMFLGTYVGPPLIWQWQRIPGNIGTSGQESVVVVGSSHFFVGPHDIYVYDGTVPRSIGAPVREWFFGDLNNTWRSNILGVSDLDRDLVYWYYPSNASTSGAIDSCLVYNIRTNEWGVADRAIEAAVSYSAGGVTYDGLGTLYTTYDNLPSLSYDSPYWLAQQTTPAIIGTDHKLYFMTGTPGASYLVTGDFGDETNWSFFSRMTPRYRLEPSAATGTNFYRADLGQTPTQDATIAQSNFGTQPRFDFRRNARWHRTRFDWTGPVAINGWTPNIVPTSPE